MPARLDSHCSLTNVQKLTFHCFLLEQPIFPNKSKLNLEKMLPVSLDILKNKGVADVIILRKHKVILVSSVWLEFVNWCCLQITMSENVKFLFPFWILESSETSNHGSVYGFTNHFLEIHVQPMVLFLGCIFINIQVLWAWCYVHNL